MSFVFDVPEPMFNGVGISKKLLFISDVLRYLQNKWELRDKIKRLSTTTPKSEVSMNSDEIRDKYHLPNLLALLPIPFGSSLFNNSDEFLQKLKLKYYSERN